MAPAANLDYETTLKRVKSKIRAGLPVLNRDLDILSKGNAHVLSDLIGKIEEYSEVDPKYKPGKKNKIPMPATPKDLKRHTSDDTKSSAKRRIKASGDIEWTGKQDIRFRLQTKQTEIVTYSEDDRKIAIGITRHDPEPKRVMVASFNDDGNLILEPINVSSDGKQFTLPEGVYEDFEFEMFIDDTLNELKDMVEFRTEINTESNRLMYTVRQYVWDQLIERGIPVHTMGWSEPNYDYRQCPDRSREMKQLQIDIEKKDPCGFMTYRNADTGRQILLTAARMGAYRESTEVEDLMQYLANPTDDQETAMEMYNRARGIIDNTFRAESQKRVDLLVIRAMNTLLPNSDPKVDWDKIPFANDRLLSISNGKTFRLIGPDDDEGESNQDNEARGKGKSIGGKTVGGDNDKGKDKAQDGETIELD
jgi:hypothetical protein